MKAQEKQMCPSIDLKAGILNFTDIQLKQIDVITIDMTGNEGQISLWRINDYKNITLHFSLISEQDKGMYVKINLISSLPKKANVVFALLI